MSHRIIIMLAVIAFLGSIGPQAHGVYSAERGRWLTRDHARYSDGVSVYLYVRSQPMKYVDPFANTSCSMVGGNGDVQGGQVGCKQPPDEPDCTCNVQLCCYELIAGRNHCFAKLECTDETSVCSGGPSGIQSISEINSGGKGGPRGPHDVLPKCQRFPNRYGAVNCYCGNYGPGNEEYQHMAQTTCQSVGGTRFQCSTIRQCMNQRCNGIDGCCNEYFLDGPNSNTVARTMLECIGDATQIPVPPNAWGWSDDIDYDCTDH